ncbi:CDF family Co(II)/Ni(II) efflux transporter DmeF [Crenothrix sp.]|uniref:CDF family Co(II)/Ni(II) efflux transporter DmeF n=1 Tax=Crenothrix sp. TaxID=3100433 RepID=UPI00374CE600
MHDDTLNHLQHPHNFVVITKKSERRTQLALLLTFFTMLVEITAGVLFGSMALLADGWHMATHVAVFTITLFANRYSRLHAQRHSFAFGAGKVGVLGSFASAVALGIVALMMLIESVQRLLSPHIIRFDEATVVAVVGLCINVLCAVLLKNHIHTDIDTDTFEHDSEDEFEQIPEHEQSPKAAYLTIFADALTSLLAIIALLAGKYYGWNALDPVMGIVGALIISRWAYSLIKETAPILLDKSIALRYKAAIQETIEADADNRIADLHIWRVSPGHFAVILSIVSHTPKTPEYYKALLTQFNLHGSKNYLAHISVEVHPCSDERCLQHDSNLTDTQTLSVE